MIHQHEMAHACVLSLRWGAVSLKQNQRAEKCENPSADRFRDYSPDLLGVRSSRRRICRAADTSDKDNQAHE